MRALPPHPSARLAMLGALSAATTHRWWVHVVGWLASRLVRPGEAVAQPADRAASGALCVVGLGDSVLSGPLGEWTLRRRTSAGAGVIAEYAHALADARGQTVRYRCLALPGAGSAQVLAQLGVHQPTRRAVAAADVVILTVGANDFSHLAAVSPARVTRAAADPANLAELQQALREILARIGQLRPGHPPASVLLTTYNNVLADGLTAAEESGPVFVAASRGLTRAVNAAVASVAAELGATCVDLYRPFVEATNGDPGQLLLPDGDHPSAAGVAVIVRELLAATPALNEGGKP